MTEEVLQSMYSIKVIVYINDMPMGTKKNNQAGTNKNNDSIVFNVLNEINETINFEVIEINSKVGLTRILKDKKYNYLVISDILNLMKLQQKQCTIWLL